MIQRLLKRRRERKRFEASALNAARGAMSRASHSGQGQATPRPNLGPYIANISPPVKGLDASLGMAQATPRPYLGPFNYEEYHEKMRELLILRGGAYDNRSNPRKSGE